MEIFESLEKPFLEFDDKEKYQVNVSLIEKLTDLKFYNAKEVLQQGQHVKLALKVNESSEFRKEKTMDSFNNNVVIEGLVL